MSMFDGMFQEWNVSRMEWTVQVVLCRGHTVAHCHISCFLGQWSGQCTWDTVAGGRNSCFGPSKYCQHASILASEISLCTIVRTVQYMMFLLRYCTVQQWRWYCTVQLIGMPMFKIHECPYRRGPTVSRHTSRVPLSAACQAPSPPCSRMFALM